jgi:ABC-2 type transport system permease protein
MNLRAGWTLVQNTWLSWLQHWGFFFLLAFGWMIPPLIYLFVWSSAAESGSIGSLTRDQFIFYYLALIVVNQLTYSQTNWTVGDLIRSGDLNRLLLYPLPPAFHTLASEVAGKVVTLTFVLPVTLLLALILQPEISVSVSNLLLFLPTLLLAWALRFVWGYWLALLAFWMTRADALLAVQDAFIFLLAGQVAPVSLLPGLVQQAATLLPFRYMLGFPVEVLTGQLTPAQIQTGLLLQIGWLLVALLLYRTTWQRGLRRYCAIGG